MKNELIRLRSIYEEKNNSALRGLDFKIYKGEVVGVVGRFHSGKTLLLEILEGNCVPDRFASKAAMNFGADLRMYVWLGESTGQY